MLDDADNEIKLNTHKKRGARDSDWWKYNSYFMYPGEKIVKKTIKHTTRMVNNPPRIPLQTHHK